MKVAKKITNTGKRVLEDQMEDFLERKSAGGRQPWLTLKKIVKQQKESKRN